MVPSSGAWTRLVPGISGLLAAEQKGNTSGPTSTTFTLRDLQGSVVGRVNAGGTPQLQMTDQFDEFGVPVDGSASERYGWLGGNKVSTETMTGVIAMGARLYLPTDGRFLQMDPAAGGSANTYDYVNQDPLDQLDLSGERPHHRLARSGPVATVSHQGYKFGHTTSVRLVRATLAAATATVAALICRGLSKVPGFNYACGAVAAAVLDFFDVNEGAAKGILKHGKCLEAGVAEHPRFGFPPVSVSPYTKTIGC